MNKSRSLDWRAILIALLLTLLASAVVGLAWGALGLGLLALAGEEGINAVSQGIIGFFIRIVVSLVPVVIGAFYLARATSESALGNCLVFGIGWILLSFLLAFALRDLGLAWDDFAYYVAIIPAAFLGQLFGNPESFQ